MNSLKHCLSRFAVCIYLSVNLMAVSGQDSPSGSLSPEQVDSLYNVVANSGKYVEKLDTASFFNMPLGLLGPGDDPAYAILIKDLVLQSDKAYFNAYLQLTNPFDGSKLAFEAQKVNFTFAGGISGNFRLMLMTEQKIKLCKDVNLTVLPGSYAESGCGGFKSLSIKGKLELAGETFVPADAEGNTKTGVVTSYFETTINNWNDLTFSISFDPFQLKSFPDVTFSCRNIAIDFSDLTNPSDIVFPSSYQSLYPEDATELWRGLYVGEATIILGKKFRKKDSNTPVSFVAKQLLIDENGFTGELAVKNILQLQDGNLGGWQFSVADLSMKFETSKIKSASLSGEIHIPVMKEKENLAYSAAVDIEGKYCFTVKPASNLNFNLFGSSKLEIYSNSSITVAVDKDKFLPEAVLNGKITFSASFSKEDTSKNKFDLPKVEFQELKLSTIEPVFDVKYLGATGLSQGAFAAFPVSIDKIELRTTTTEARLSFGIIINLMNSSEQGFGGKADLTIVAERDGYKFKYKGIELDRIQVDIVKPKAFEIHGVIAFARDDPDYGNGFRGQIDAKFGTNIEIEAVALFGKVNGIRYFFVDGLFAMKPGIQAGPLTFYGFGGGLYYHMKQQPGQIDANSFGASRSGLVYKPDASIGIGIMAEVKFGVIKEQIIDADVKFEIVFNASGGLNRIAFLGNAKCIVPGVDIVPDKIKAAAQKLAGKDGKLDFSPTDAAIAATVSMEMDFEHDVFHAELEAFINVGPVLTGVGPNGSAGKCVMHIEPQLWYLYIGTPSNPLGVKLLGMISASSYFMVGHGLPESLPLHPTVASILHITPDEACANRDNTKLQGGKGIAFGSSFSVNTGDLTLLCFYGRFEVGAGYDILLLDKGKDSYCAGHSAPMGINGWYAMGQAYAYLDGRIGIKVKVFGKSKKFEILSIGAAALLRAEGPNPTYLEGQAGGRFSLLGGMVSGECKFKVSYGEKCQMVLVNQPSPLTDLEMIAAVTPEINAKDVDVFIVPQAVFNVPINKEMKISDDNGISHKFRALLEKCTFKKSGADVPGTTELNSENNVLVFKTNDILYPETEYYFEVSISFEEFTNGSWVPVNENGTKLTETKTAKFTTGKLPAEIPLDKISYSYPINKMCNFYPQEYNEGYIKFSLGLKPYFDPGNDWLQRVRFVPVNGTSIAFSDMNYNDAEHMVKFSIPSNLSLNTIYRLEFVNFPVNSDVAKNVTEKMTTIDLKDESNTNSMDVKTKSATGTISAADEIIFVKYGFRVSKYKTFAEKLSFGTVKVNILYEIYAYAYYLWAAWYGDETFDKFEVSGNNSEPLLRRYADLSNTPWYKSDVYPVIYQNYPIAGAPIKWRTNSDWGVPPTKKIDMSKIGNDHVLTDEEIETGVSTTTGDYVTLFYTLPYNWAKDYDDIRAGLANIYPTMKSSNTQINRILSSPFWPVVDIGNYPVVFEYVLPGINKVSSAKTLTIYDPFDLIQPQVQ